MPFIVHMLLVAPADLVDLKGLLTILSDKWRICWLMNMEGNMIAYSNEVIVVLFIFLRFYASCNILDHC